MSLDQRHESIGQVGSSVGQTSTNATTTHLATSASRLTGQSYFSSICPNMHANRDNSHIRRNSEIGYRRISEAHSGISTVSR